MLYLGFIERAAQRGASTRIRENEHAGHRSQLFQLRAQMAFEARCGHSKLDCAVVQNECVARRRSSRVDRYIRGAKLEDPIDGGDGVD